MNFDETLKLMLTFSGIKGNQLAAALGYDTSYVSRWLTGDKLPSNKNKEQLFKKITEFIVNNADETELKTIAVELNLHRIPETQEEFLTTFETILKDSYFRQRGIRNKYNHGVLVSENGIVTKESTGEAFYSLIAESIYSAKNDMRNTIEIMTTESIEYLPHQGKDLTAVLSEVANKECPIHVYHIIDRSALKNVNNCCRGLIHVLNVCDGLQYDVFISDNPLLCQTQLTVLKDEFYLRRISDYFVPHPYLLVSRDDWLIANAVLAFKESIKDSRLALEQVTVHATKSRQHLNYLMQDRYGDILNIMHPLYMEPDFYKELFEKYKHDNGDMDLFFGMSMCQARIKTVVLFKTALLDYLYNGRIVFLGVIQHISPEERVRHLKQLSDAISKNPDFRLAILTDNNPLLDYNELDCSLFLTERTALAIHSSLKHDTVSFLANDLDIVNSFWDYLESLYNLPVDYCLKGQELLNYINNAIAWLEIS